MVSWGHNERGGEREWCELSDILIALLSVVLVEFVRVVAEENERVELESVRVILHEIDCGLSALGEILISSEDDFRSCDFSGLWFLDWHDEIVRKR